LRVLLAGSLTFAGHLQLSQIMKHVFLMTLFVAFAATADAQLKGFSVGPYAEMAWPSGNMKTENKKGIGAGVSADIRLGKLGLTGSTGILRFGGNTADGPDGSVNYPSITVIPVRAGFKYRFVPLFYAKLEGGLAKYTDGTQSAFILSPGVGVRVLGLDVQAKYETWVGKTTRTFAGVKVGYNF
jgi:hypothetical protein